MNDVLGSSALLARLRSYSRAHLKLSITTASTGVGGFFVYFGLERRT